MANFPQTYAVKLADLVFRFAPLLALVTAYVQGQFWGASQIHLTTAMVLLFLSLPVQGYLLLGLRAQQRLPAALQSWYKEIEQKLKESDLQPVKQPNKNQRHKLTYMDLAIILDQLFNQSRK